MFFLKKGVSGSRWPLKRRSTGGAPGLKRQSSTGASVAFKKATKQPLKGGRRGADGGCQDTACRICLIALSAPHVVYLSALYTCDMSSVFLDQRKVMSTGVGSP